MAAGISTSGRRGVGRHRPGTQIRRVLGRRYEFRAACNGLDLHVGYVSFHRFLQDPPRLVAEFSLPFGIKARLAELLAERRRVRLIENQTLRGQVLLKTGVQLGDVVALFPASVADVLRHHFSHVLGQPLPRAAVGEEPEPVPHVIGQRAVSLDFIEFRGGDDGDRILLTIDNLGLESRIDLIEID